MGVEQEYVGQSCSCIGYVYDVGVGKVVEVKVVQRVYVKYRGIVSGSGIFYWVDEVSYDDGEDQESLEFYVFSYGIGDDGYSGCYEDYLEEEVRCVRVDGIIFEVVFMVGEVVQNCSCVNVGNVGQEDVIVVYDGVIVYQVYDVGNGKQCYVFGQDFGGVFGVYQVGFQYCEVCGYLYY